MPLTHINDQGRARMVDVSEKAITHRIAVAAGSIYMQPETLQAIIDGQIKKGDVLAVAQVAGIMAAKQTSAIIPMCHPLMLSGIDIHFETDTEEMPSRSRPPSKQPARPAWKWKPCMPFQLLH